MLERFAFLAHEAKSSSGIRSIGACRRTTVFGRPRCRFDRVPPVGRSGSIGGLIESICCISLTRRIRPFSKPDSPGPACLAFRAVPGVVARHLFSKLGVKLSDLVSVRLLASEAIHIVTEYFLQRRDSVRSVSTHEKFPSVLLYVAGILSWVVFALSRLFLREAKFNLLGQATSCDFHSRFFRVSPSLLAFRYLLAITQLISRVVSGLLLSSLPLSLFLGGTFAL